MAHKRKIKRPSPTGGRRFRDHPSSSSTFRDSHPVFSFHKLVSGYCVDDCDVAAKVAFLDAMRKRSRMTWMEIHQTRREGLGCEQIPRAALNVQVPSAISDDINFISLRAGRRRRIIGYQERAILHIIWLDRDHSVYS